MSQYINKFSFNFTINYFNAFENKNKIYYLYIMYYIQNMRNNEIFKKIKIQFLPKKKKK